MEPRKDDRASTPQADREELRGMMERPILPKVVLPPCIVFSLINGRCGRECASLSRYCDIHTTSSLQCVNCTRMFQYIVPAVEERKFLRLCRECFHVHAAVDRYRASIGDSVLRAKTVNRGPLKVYMAGRYEDRDIVDTFMTKLQDTTYVRSASEWYKLTLDNHDMTWEQKSDLARQQMMEIDNCDALLLFSPSPSRPLLQRGGCIAEAGYALARGKKVVAVGGIGPVMMYAPEVVKADTLSDACYLLEFWAANGMHRS